MVQQGTGKIFLLLLLCLPGFAADSSPALLIEQGHYKRAHVILSERLKANPSDARSNCDMSHVSSAFQHWDEAIQQAEKARSFDGKNADFQAAVADALMNKLASAPGGMFEKMSLSRRFRKEADLALQLDPQNAMVNDDLMQYYLAAPSLMGGSTSKAADLADRMVRANPPRGYLMKLEVAMHQKRAAEVGADPAQAEQSARQALRIDPGRAGPYMVLAMLYARQSRWKEMDAVLADSQRSVPDDLAPFYQVAEEIFTSNQAQEFSRAETLLRTYLRQPAEGNEPTLAMAHWRLGLVLEREGHRDQAKAEIQQAVSLDSAFQPAKKDLKRLK
jgi:tetratricopeptide (TPR) repeat protein